MMFGLYRIDNGQAFLIATDKIVNADGSVSFKLINGLYGGQEPNVYGKRNDNTEIKPYQKFTQVNDTTVVSLTRPGDTPFIYMLAVGVAYNG